MSYSAEKGVWFMDYHQKKTLHIRYTVEIDDKTGKARTVVNDYW